MQWYIGLVSMFGAVLELLGVLVWSSARIAGSTRLEQCSNCWEYSFGAVLELLGVLVWSSARIAGSTRLEQCSNCWEYSGSNPLLLHLSPTSNYDPH